MKLTLTPHEAAQIIREYYSYDDSVQIIIEPDDCVCQDNPLLGIEESIEHLPPEQEWFENAETSEKFPVRLVGMASQKITVELNDGFRQIGYPNEWNLMWNTKRTQGFYIKKWKYGWN